MEQDYLTSNFSHIDKYIELNIEKKINQLLESLPSNVDPHTFTTPKMIYEYTVLELYQGTIQTVIDIINDLTVLSITKLTGKAYRKQLFNIFLSEDRKIFVGIILVLLSFILYFIDGAET